MDSPSQAHLLKEEFYSLPPMYSSIHYDLTTAIIAIIMASKVSFKGNK